MSPPLARAISPCRSVPLVCRPTQTASDHGSILEPRRFQPFDDLFGVLRIMSFQCPAGEDPLHIHYSVIFNQEAPNGV
jgi:hypothetical protein